MFAPTMFFFFFFFVRLFATPWTVACQAPLFMGFSGQEYWRGCTNYVKMKVVPQSDKVDA